MNKHFEIIGGIVYLDKKIFADAMQRDNNVSKLTGSTCENIFNARPRIQCGVESVTIDYSLSDRIRIDQDPEIYIHNLQDQYHNQVRGHLVIDIGLQDPIDMTISSF